MRHSKKTYHGPEEEYLTLLSMVRGSNSLEYEKTNVERKMSKTLKDKISENLKVNKYNWLGKQHDAIVKKIRLDVEGLSSSTLVGRTVSEIDLIKKASAQRHFWIILNMAFSKIDSHSVNIATSALNIFSTPPTNISVSIASFREYLTLNPISSKPHHFKIHASTGYIDLNNCYLATEMRIKKQTAGVWVNLEATDNLAPIQMIG